MESSEPHASEEHSAAAAQKAAAKDLAAVFFTQVTCPTPTLSWDGWLSFQPHQVASVHEVLVSHGMDANASAAMALKVRGERRAVSIYGR